MKNVEVILPAVFITFCSSFLMKNKFKKWFNYVNIINFMWLVGIITTYQGFYEIYRPQNRTYTIIIIFLLCFNIVSYLAVKKTEQRTLHSHFIIHNIESQNKIETILLIGVILLMIPEFLSSVRVIMSGGYNTVRENVLTSFTFIQWLLYHFGNPLIIALTIIAIVDVVFFGKNKFNLLLSFVAVLIDITIFASRGLLTQVLLVLIVCLLLKYHFKLKEVVRKHKVIVISIIIAICLLFFITSQRKMSGGNSTIMENLYYYFWGSFSCMDNHLDNINAYIAVNGHTYYLMFISGIVGVFSDILSFFGFKIQTGIQIINPIVQEYVAVSPNIRMNNNVTMLTAFYFDAGWAGIVFYSLIVTFILAWLYNKMIKLKCADYVAYFAFTFAWFFFGITEWTPARATTIWVYIFMFIIYKIRIIKITYR